MNWSSQIRYQKRRDDRVNAKQNKAQEISANSAVMCSLLVAMQNKLNYSQQAEPAFKTADSYQLAAQRPQSF